MRAFSPRAVSPSTDPSFDRFEPAVSSSFRELIFKDLVEFSRDADPVAYAHRILHGFSPSPFEWRL